MRQTRAFGGSPAFNPAAKPASVEVFCFEIGGIFKTRGQQFQLPSGRPDAAKGFYLAQRDNALLDASWSGAVRRRSGRTAGRIRLCEDLRIRMDTSQTPDSVSFAVAFGLTRQHWQHDD